MRLLELYCGTKSIGKEFARVGYEVVSVDIDPQFSPTICADILTLDPHDFRGFDALWASFPCNGFSVAVIGRNWNHDHTPKNDAARHGLTLLRKTIEFQQVIKPRLFWFENPRGKARRMPELQGYGRQTVTYCQYGDTRMKPTDIWTNTDWRPRPMCKNGGGCHEAAPRGSKTGTQGMKGAKDRAVIPQELCRELAEYAVQSAIVRRPYFQPALFASANL